MGGDKKQLGAWLDEAGAWFGVWAPNADEVWVRIMDYNWALEREGDYWFGHVDNVKAGYEYSYVIRNGENTLWKQDPRARHFTTTSGNSVVVDQNFDWEDDNFNPIPFNEQVIYELHVGSFNKPDPAAPGTFRDVMDKLDHLADLGVNMIELMPINSMAMDRGWGYSSDYIFAIESLYGGRHGFLEFVKAAHKKGIGVIVDVVYNHWGPDNDMDLWQYDGWSQDGQGGIYFYNDWRAKTPWGDRPDYGRLEVQDYITDNVLMWLNECHIDGLRLDSTIYIRNTNGANDDPANDLPDGWNIMQKVNGTAHWAKPGAIIIAEDAGVNEYITKPTDAGGAGFNAQWDLNFPFAIRDALHTNDAGTINLGSICSELVKYFNGDAMQRVIYSDSHDTAANGSARFPEQISPGNAGSTFAQQQAVMAAALVLTAPGIPMLLQGQEFMQHGEFSDLTGLDWSKQEYFAGVFEAHKDLINIRKNKFGTTRGLQGKDINVMHVDGDNKVVAYHRWCMGGPKDDVVVIVNFSDRQHNDYHLPMPRSGLWKVRFNSTAKKYNDEFRDVITPDVNSENGGASIVLPPASVIVLSQDD